MTRRNPTEKDVKNDAKKLLNKHGWFFWTPPANQFGASGISDLHAVKPGVFMAIEFKYGTNKVTALQRGFLATIHASDHLAFVVTDRNMHYFSSWLAAFDRASEAVHRGESVHVDDGAIMVNCAIELQRGFIDFKDVATQPEAGLQ